MAYDGLGYLGLSLARLQGSGRVLNITTQDSDAANVAIDYDKEAQAFTVIADDVVVAW